MAKFKHMGLFIRKAHPCVFTKRHPRHTLASTSLLCRAPSVTHRMLLGKPECTWWFIYIKQLERSLQVLHGDGIA